MEVVATRILFQCVAFLGGLLKFMDCWGQFALGSKTERKHLKGMDGPVSPSLFPRHQILPFCQSRWHLTDTHKVSFWCLCCEAHDIFPWSLWEQWSKFVSPNMSNMDTSTETFWFIVKLHCFENTKYCLNYCVFLKLTKYIWQQQGAAYFTHKYAQISL